MIVKICGLTRLEDALHAARCGADLLGFVLVPSPRRCDPREVVIISREIEGQFPGVGRVGVFLNPKEEDLSAAAEELRLTHLQIHGRALDRRPAGIPWIAAIGVGSAGDAVLPPGDPWAVLLEPRSSTGAGGTGRSFPCEWAVPLIAQARVFIAGGLDAPQGRRVLRAIRPFGLDASSGLEQSPGIKDAEKVEAFIRMVREEDRVEGGAG